MQALAMAGNPTSILDESNMMHSVARVPSIDTSSACFDNSVILYLIT